MSAPGHANSQRHPMTHFWHIYWNATHGEFGSDHAAIFSPRGGEKSDIDNKSAGREPHLASWNTA